MLLGTCALIEYLYKITATVAGHRNGSIDSFTVIAANNGSARVQAAGVDMSIGKTAALRYVLYHRSKSNGTTVSQSTPAASIIAEASSTRSRSGIEHDLALVLVLVLVLR